MKEKKLNEEIQKKTTNLPTFYPHIYHRKQNIEKNIVKGLIK